MQRPAGSSCSSTFLSTGRCPRASSRSYLHGSHPVTHLPVKCYSFASHACTSLPKMLKKQQAVGTPKCQVVLLK